MTEFRVLLEGGNVLVVSLSVETPETVEVPDAATLGESLLAALGLSRPTKTRTVAAMNGIPQSKPKRPAPPPEMNPDTWLRQTSERSLGAKFKSKTRADGDVGE